MARLARMEVFAPEEIAIVHVMNRREPGDTHFQQDSSKVWILARKSVRKSVVPALPSPGID